MSEDKAINSESSNFGLNDHHQSLLKSYIQFTRYLRQQNLKSVDLSFQDVIESRLLEATYTQREVTQLLQNLKQLVTLDIENELINVSHINCLLLKQLFTQAEKWYLYLNIDLSEIQNKHLLEDVRSFDSAPASDTTSLADIKCYKLAPLEQIQLDKISEILKTEIEKLKAGNEALVLRNEELSDENRQLKQQRDSLNSLLDEREVEVEALRSRVEERVEGKEEKGGGQSEVDSVLHDFEQVLSEQLSNELGAMKKEISKAQAQLQLAEEELERKFNQTMTYANMKKMIRKKNDQIRELRRSLSKFDPDGVDDCDSEGE